MTRKEYIIQEALRIHNDDDISRFVAGAEWADANPVSETFTYSDQAHQELEDKLKIATEHLKLISKCGILNVGGLKQMAEFALGKLK